MAAEEDNGGKRTGLWALLSRASLGRCWSVELKQSYDDGHFEVVEVVVMLVNQTTGIVHG